MLKSIFVAVVALAFSLPSVALTQEVKKGVQKMEMKEHKKEGLKSVTCDPACGFSVRSHDEKELTAIVKEHAKAHHNMEMTDEQVRGMMKDAMVEKMIEKKVEKKEEME
jgi:predicted small metal-binding protein